MKKCITIPILITGLIIVCGIRLTAGPDNIAPEARVEVSSSASESSGAMNITDGIIHIDGRGEWVSENLKGLFGWLVYPEVQLNWETARSINQVKFYDRPDLNTHIAGGTLYFSDGTEVSVTRIPNDGSPGVVSFPEKTVDWIRFVVTDAVGENLGLSEIEVFPAPSAYKDYVSWVDPYIETTRGRYFYCITGNQPFGMIGAAPLTRNKNQRGGGYNYNTTEILGFPQLHGWMLSGLTLMPTTGDVHPSQGEQHWKSSFSHEDEIIQPAYHRVFLEDYGIWVEQTAGDRVSFYRLTYTRDAVSEILFNLGGYLANSTMTGALVTKISDTRIEGEFTTVGREWGGPDRVKIYFVAEFDRPFEQMNGWAGEKQFEDISLLEGIKGSRPTEGRYRFAESSGVSTLYKVEAGDRVQVKMAVSYTGIENARNNLESESDHWDFDKLRTKSRKEWNQWLGRIDVKGGTVEQKIKFYTDLWHVLMGRHKIDDANGDYPDYTEGERQGPLTVNARLKVRTLPKNDEEDVIHHMYNSDAFWYTLWNLNTLWALAWPEIPDEFSASLVQYADNGGLLPRGPNMGGYSYIMTGCPATPLIVSTYHKGLLTRTDARHAYRVMKKNHMPGGMLEPDETYLEKGYYTTGWGPAGLTLEACFQDWSLAQMATRLNETDDAAYFQERSEGWKKLYRDEFKLIFPRDRNGAWLHDDPLSPEGFVEANAWQATWSVSHDISGLAGLMGSNDLLCEKLNHAFEMAEPTDFVYEYGSGYVSYANQPGCSNAHVFNHAGKPWLSQYWVRKVNEQAYGAITPDKGYGGHDEDQGQMGGISALMSMGLFSLRGTCSIDPVYEITAPVFDEIIIKLDPRYYQGKEFIIKTYNNSKENCYIRKARLNGRDLKQLCFYHREYALGGLLEIWLGAEPNKEFTSSCFSGESE